VDKVRNGFLSHLGRQTKDPTDTAEPTDNDSSSES
jgi:hypothetical protein